MSRIRGKDTTPERVVRSLLHRLGYRFRLHVRIPITTEHNKLVNHKRTQRAQRISTGGPSVPASRSPKPSTLVSRPSTPRFVTPDILLPRHRVANSGIKVAARTIGRLPEHRPLVRFTRNEVGGTALVPLLPDEADGRCSPDFDPAPFQAGKGNEVWANFEFVNVEESDRDLLAFALKADKPGRKDRFRAEHDIGCGHSGNKPTLCAMISPPTEGDYGYYFLDRGVLKTEELLQRNPGAAIKITISNHARGPVG